MPLGPQSLDALEVLPIGLGGVAYHVLVEGCGGYNGFNGFNGFNGCNGCNGYIMPRDPSEKERAG
jgi:hypothetical protein